MKLCYKKIAKIRKVSFISQKLEVLFFKFGKKMGKIGVIIITKSYSEN